MIPKIEFEPQRPRFVWLQPCANCPSKGESCPETKDILKWPFFRRMRTAFACAWRPEGYCAGYYHKMLTGRDTAALAVAKDEK
jgi:hypothetical protein